MNSRLRVNPILCAAHGVCAELLPELISLDPWGYPLLAPGPVPAALLPLARRAVTDCPALALLLDRVPEQAPRRELPKLGPGLFRPGPRVLIIDAVR